MTSRAADGAEVPYDGLVIATGVRPRRLPGDQRGCHVLRTLDDVLALKDRLANGGRVEADEVLVAVGSVPNTEWLEDSGLPVGDGLECDEFSAAAPGVYGAGDVARWQHPLFGTAMRIEHRTNATEQGMAAARNLLAPAPEARRPYQPVPYFWSDQYGLRVQAYGHLRGHEEVAVVEGGLDEGAFLAAYRCGDRLTGVLAVGVPPRVLRTWRQSITAGSRWTDTVRRATTVV
ncbi:FAD-dependent oxidoreductase [Streptomyces sp. NPDC001700]